MYDKDDLKQLRQACKDEIAAPDTLEEDQDQLEEFCRLLEALKYNPLLVTDAAEDYDIADALSVELEDVPLHINDAGILSKVVVQWRLEIGK